tara:strand:- start:4829 stop:5770 length:942 start_codon:yes stop_codon:yes gene_type:complete
MFVNSIDNIKVLILSILFIVSSFLLLIKISPHAFVIFNSIPLLIVGLILGLKYIFYVFLGSGIILTLISNFYFLNSETAINLQILIIFLGIFFVSFALLFLIKNNLKNFSKSTGAIVSKYIFLISSTLLIFFYNNNYELNLDLFTDEMKKIYNLQFAKENVSTKIQIDKLINIFIKILPSIYISFLFFITIFNLKISENILRNLNFKKFNRVSFKNFQIPNWTFFSFIVFFILASTLSDFLQTLFLNLTIIFSSIFILSGFIRVLEFFEKYNINLFLKIIILFLLFIFFSYVLLLLLFILGLSKHLRKVLNSN